MWTDYITSISHVLKVNEYGGRQAKVNEKRQCFKGWETLVNSDTKRVPPLPLQMGDASLYPGRQ